MRSLIIPIVIVLYNVWTPSRSLGTTESDDTYKERPINIFFAADHFFREMTGDELQKYAESLLAGVTISTNPEWMDLPCSLRLRVSAVHMLSDKEEAILLPKLTLYDSDGTQREYVDDTAYSAGHPPRMEDILEDSYYFSAADIVVILTGHPTVSGNPYCYLTEGESASSMMPPLKKFKRQCHGCTVQVAPRTGY
ncbi:uncharacterized protein LOC135374824 isoform X1 [Ornithodoros turicata]|uniref:uncharacterized protein LOC135374824 isoform X1 n=1 Tax=Ornithodoros turicata TaxID=34597 RepID=UPI0031394F0A